LKTEQLTTKVLERGTTWLDTGTFASLLAASVYVQIIEERQGSKISCLEEISWRNKWITSENLMQIGSKFNNEYGAYIMNLLTN
jgi:glucose-1-phosphate thymidylyltransferase